MSKKVIFVTILLFSVCITRAQDIRFDYRTGKLRIGESVINEQDYHTYFDKESLWRFKSAKDYLMIGSVVIGGSAVVSLGTLIDTQLISRITGEEPDYVPPPSLYWICAGAGAIGGVVYLIGRHKMNVVIGELNEGNRQKNQAELSFGLNPSGIGFALFF